MDSSPLLGIQASKSSPMAAVSKGIGFFGGLCLIFNNACGAGITSLPLIFKDAGWGTATIAMTFFWIASSLTSTMIIDAMRAAPRNEDGSCVELTGCAKHYTGRVGQIVTHVFLFCLCQSLSVAAIIISAQAFDQMVVTVFGQTCGVGSISESFGFGCSHSSKQDSPFDDGDVVLSLGFMLAAVCTIPLAMCELEDNITIQIVCFFLSLACFLSWFASILAFKELEPIPFNSPNYSQLCGTLLYNFAYVVTIPSWYNEKVSGVSVKLSVWTASTACFLFYAGLGYIGGSAYLDTLSNKVDLLAALNHDGLAQLAVYFFPIMDALSGVPIFCIIMRSNLREGNACGRWKAMFVSVFLPWIIALPFQTGSGLQKIINLSALLFSSVMNFIVPLACVFVFARRVAANKTVSVRGVLCRKSTPAIWCTLAMGLIVVIAVVTLRAVYDVRTVFESLLG